MQRVQAKPSALQGPGRDVQMERAKRARLKRRPARAPALLVKGEQLRERGLPRRVVGNQLEPHAELLLERAQTPPRGRPVRGADGRQKRVPRVAGQADERARALAHLPDRPSAFGQRRRQSGEQRVRRQMIEMERHVLRSRVFGERCDGFGLAAPPDDGVQVIRAGGTGPEELQAREERQPAARGRERDDGDQLAAATHRKNGQAPRLPEMRPPRVQPLPREERRLGGARLEQIGPVPVQRVEPPGTLDDLNRHESSDQARSGAPRVRATSTTWA